MPKNTFLLLRFCLTSLFLSALTIRAASPNQPPSDLAIGLAVENELLSSEAVEGHRLDAECRQGVLTLSGRVDHLLAKRHATDLARQVRGVLTVINRIVVYPEERRKDQEVAADIEAAWREEEVTEARQLTVTVRNGVAILGGTVESRAEQGLAERIAAAVIGVADTDNRIKVQAQDQRPDSEIAEEVTALIEGSARLDDEDIEVSVKNGHVLLSGQVGSAYAKSVANELAWTMGVQGVDSRGLQVDFDLYDGMRRRQRMAEITDEKIVATIGLAFRQDPRLLSYAEDIAIESEDGSVSLAGKVRRSSVKRLAEDVARNTLGVWRVKNRLKVRGTDKEPSAHDIIRDVQNALARDPYVSRHGLRVHCRNAHVSLYGLVDSEFEKQAAGWIASRQKGVVHVNNNLSVAKKWTPRSDAEIAADIDEKFAYVFFHQRHDIDVKVHNGVAILRGTVDTWREWQLAMDKVIEAGARRPHNLLKVRYHPAHGGARIYVPK